MSYIVITSQVIGGESVPMRVGRYWDGYTFRERDQAVSHGFRTRESDDFNIGMINKAGALHSIWWMDERLNEPPETLRDISQEIGLRWMYRQTITYETLSQLGVRKGICEVCGQRGRRQRTFTMTENPFNKNPDGSVRNRREIYAALRKRADAWEREPFVHPKCESV